MVFKIISFNKILIFCLNKRTPLHEAVEKENIQIIKLLLQQKGIDVNAEDEIFFIILYCI